MNFAIAELKQLPPKTTGRELFGKAYTSSWLKAAVERGLPHENIVATATAITAHSIAHAYLFALLGNDWIHGVPNKRRVPAWGG